MPELPDITVYLEALERRVVGNAERPAELERDPECARRPHDLGVLTYQADADGRNALALEEVAQRAHGARAGGSNRDEQRGIDPVGLQQTGQVLRVASPVNDTAVVVRPIASGSVQPAPASTAPASAAPTAAPAAPPSAATETAAEEGLSFQWPTRGQVIAGFDESKNKG